MGEVVKSMKIPKDTMRRLQLAKMLLESVEESLEKYGDRTYVSMLPQEDTVSTIHRRLVQAREEIAVANRSFDAAYHFETLSKLEENKNE